MSLNLETLQTTATVENGVLRGTELLPQFNGETVQIVVIRVKTESAATASVASDYDASELTPQQWERGASVLMAADFANDTAEDIYSRKDGKAFDASQY